MANCVQEMDHVAVQGNQIRLNPSDQFDWGHTSSEVDGVVVVEEVLVPSSEDVAAVDDDGTVVANVAVAVVVLQMTPVTLPVEASVFLHGPLVVQSLIHHVTMVVVVVADLDASAVVDILEGALAFHEDHSIVVVLILMPFDGEEEEDHIDCAVVVAVIVEVAWNHFH